MDVPLFVIVTLPPFEKFRYLKDELQALTYIFPFDGALDIIEHISHYSNEEIKQH